MRDGQQRNLSWLMEQVAIDIVQVIKLGAMQQDVLPIFYSCSCIAELALSFMTSCAGHSIF